MSKFSMRVSLTSSSFCFESTEANLNSSAIDNTTIETVIPLFECEVKFSGVVGLKKACRLCVKLSEKPM